MRISLSWGESHTVAGILCILCACMSLYNHALAAGDSGYIGSKTCADCHRAEYDNWQGSHHDLAMQPANSKTVLGDFDKAEFVHFGVTSTFYREGDRFLVRTDGANGSLRDFEISYTFGVDPLQQYLIEIPGGRLQALSIAWDARPQSVGGQRWFHLYPGEQIPHDDLLHWTQPSQNWNNMCAECHSTGLQKNYDAEKRSFDTTWAEVNVTCEACHGPGADHQVWAERGEGWQQLQASRGLAVMLDERRGVHWKIDAGASIARRSQPRESAREIETCARCHSRRSAVSSDYRHGEPLLDHYLPALLSEGLYHADGQIDDEVYVYGSFLQSKMNAVGVTCSDCHEAHSLALRAPANGVCLQCHQADRYDVSTHHFHESDSPGASCAECHMPTRDYMVVDPRHDHSMRIPRPDLSVTLGMPNACNNCHSEQSADWAAGLVGKWYGDSEPGYQQYAEILSAARRGAASGDALAALIRNPATPAIARATALSRIGPYLSNQTLDVLRMGLADEDPTMRVAALTAVENLPMQMQVQFAFPMLQDEVLLVRMEASRILAPIPVGDLPVEQRRLLADAGREYVAAQLANAERPEAQTNLGNYYAAQGERKPALAAYQTALELAPYYLPAYINLADFYRRLGSEDDALELLQRAARQNPDAGAVHHALGLTLVRMRRYPEALAELELAAELEPGDASFVYVYAVGLNSLGESQQAIQTLQDALLLHPRNREILTALVSFLRDGGDADGAQRYAEQLRALQP
ncbi:MAG: tetratricopeptide repeat protein [Gammaproteobacteria bacterium]|nr:tetratricopeptide repeat protein [Gammaproteobacteria bacterium]